MRCWLLVFVWIFAGCDYEIITPTPVINVNSTSTNTNTNTNTNTTNTTVDTSDTEPTPAPPGTTPPPSPGGVLPLPAYGEAVTLQLGAANPQAVQKSCQTTDGAQAWAFMDLLITGLRAAQGDSRWGYLCKDASCSTFGRDVVAYKAGATDLGIWIVDVLGNHCPGPGDSPTQVRWGVLPFETVRRWSATR